jgi:hypothetical protein
MHLIGEGCVRIIGCAGRALTTPMVVVSERAFPLPVRYTLYAYDVSYRKMLVVDAVIYGTRIPTRYVLYMHTVTYREAW